MWLHAQGAFDYIEVYFVSGSDATFFRHLIVQKGRMDVTKKSHPPNLPKTYYRTAGAEFDIIIA